MVMNLLQQGGFNPGPANNQAAAAGVAGMLGVVLCIAVVMIIVVYAPYIFMLVKAMQALQAVRPRNRSMAPGLVWLGLIPCAPLIMNFVIVLKCSESLDTEFDDRGMKSRGDHGKQVGLIFAVIVLVNIALNGASNVLSGAMNQGGGGPAGPIVGVVMALGCLSLVLIIAQIVLPIIYGLRLSESTGRLRRSEGRYRDEDDGDDRDEGDDDFDDEPKPKPRKKPKLDDGFEEYDEPKGGR